eukprot:TRINITY_DN1063_c0_g3_i2.p1 TRINITY_DN1063_c0_g3~~TRINITY_DN1063_c0_g3_i2.p1  ORF type:complete len:108 (-),score=55.95 TRINITY_DN1063_c0_g3_i2:145-429(-)
MSDEAVSPPLALPFAQPAERLTSAFDKWAQSKWTAPIRWHRLNPWGTGGGTITFFFFFFFFLVFWGDFIYRFRSFLGPRRRLFRPTPEPPIFPV